MVHGFNRLRLAKIKISLALRMQAWSRSVPKSWFWNCESQAHFPKPYNWRDGASVLPGVTGCFRLEVRFGLTAGRLWSSENLFQRFISPKLKSGRLGGVVKHMIQRSWPQSGPRAWVGPSVCAKAASRGPVELIPVCCVIIRETVLESCPFDFSNINSSMYKHTLLLIERAI